MLNLNSINSREDFKWDVIRKAHADSDFRAALRKDPSGTVGKMANMDGLKVNLHQETPDNVFFLINYNPDLPGAANAITISPSDNPEEVVVKKAWKDPAYRAGLLANPDAVLRSEFGTGMPAGAKLVVLEEGKDTLELILPAHLDSEAAPAAAAQGGELTDDELEGVAGGGFFHWLAIKLGMTSKDSSCNASGNSHNCGCTSASGVRA